MVRNVPKRSYVVGYELANSTLMLYIDKNDPERFDSFVQAQRLADKLNKEPHSRSEDAKTDWYVYEMRIKKAIISGQ